jgi:hypothetical protein
MGDMPIQRDYHVRQHANGWLVTKQGALGAGSIHSTKSEALAVGRECAKRDHVDLIVHRKDGTEKLHR